MFLSFIQFPKIFMKFLIRMFIYETRFIQLICHFTQLFYPLFNSMNIISFHLYFRHKSSQFTVATTILSSKQNTISLNNVCWKTKAVENKTVWKLVTFVTRESIPRMSVWNVFVRFSIIIFNIFITQDTFFCIIRMNKKTRV